MPITAECSMRRCQATAVTLPWQPHHAGHVGNLMGWDHPCFVPICPLGGELWHFQYFPTWRPSAILKFKSFNIWSRDCHCGHNLLLCIKFYQNWFTCSASRCPYKLNVQCDATVAMGIASSRTSDMMGCDHSSFIPIGPLVGELWYFQYFPTWRPSAILNFKNF